MPKDRRKQKREDFISQDKRGGKESRGEGAMLPWGNVLPLCWHEGSVVEEWEYLFLPKTEGEGGNTKVCSQCSG